MQTGTIKGLKTRKPS